MNIAFASIMLISVIMLLLRCPNMVMSTMYEGVDNALHLLVTLIPIYAICMCIIEISTRLYIDKKLGNMMRPLTRRLFHGEDNITLGLIASNFAMNMLGMGGAATPLGIKAVERMQQGKSRATDNSILFAVINATSIQLLPMTIIGMRSSLGASNPADIVLPSLISTTVATLVGIALARVCRG